MSKEEIMEGLKDLIRDRESFITDSSDEIFEKDKKVLEKELEKRLVDKVKQLGGKAFKFVSPGNAGVPDRLVILPGNKIGFAEMKRPGGKTTKLQDKQIKFIKSLKCLVMVIDNETKIDKFIGRLQTYETSI